MGPDRGAGLANAGPAGLPGGLGREIAQQGRKADAARSSLRLQLIAHAVVQANGNGGTHEPCVAR